MKNIVITVAVVLTISCNQRENKEKNAVDKLEETIGNVKSNSKSTDFDIQQDKLLTVDMVATAFEVPATDIQTKLETNNKNGGYANYVNYSWKGSRKHEIAKGMSIPVDNMVRLDGIKATTRSAFDYDYRNLTEEEQKKANEQFQKILDQQAEKANLSDEQKKVAKSVSGGIMNTGKYEEVTGAGEKAMWQTNAGILYILYNNVKFNITVKSDKGNDKEKAIDFANAIISKMK